MNPIEAPTRLCLFLGIAILLGCTSERSSVGTRNPNPPYTQPSTEDALPEEGSFRFRPVSINSGHSVLPGIHGGSGFFPQMGAFGIDYAGPKQYVELYVENYAEEKLISSEVVYREKFGSADRTTRPGSASYFESEAFTRPRQNFSFRMYNLLIPVDPSQSGPRSNLKDSKGDAKNTLLSVFSFDADAQDFWEARQSTFYSTYNDPELEGGPSSSGEPPNFGVFKDTESVEVSNRTILKDDQVLKRTKLLLRFVAQ